MKSSRALMLLAGLAVVCASGQTQTSVFSTGQAARLVIGQTNFTAGNYGATNTLLGSPAGLAYANGVLWVVDANRLGGTPDNNRVLRFSDVATYPTPTEDPTISGSTCGVCRGAASLVLGQPDFVDGNYALTPTGMRNPTSVATDGNVVAVADTDNNRVLIWLSQPKVNGQPADVVIGQPDFVHNGTAAPPTAKSLRGPQGLWIAGGKLYVADTQDNRVLIYNQIPTTNNVAADVVIGAPNFTTAVVLDLIQSSSVSPTAANMQTPVSVTTDGTRMFVADLAQNRILIWNTIPTTNGAPADIALGQINLTTGISNNSSTVTNATLDADNNPEGVTGVMCQSNAAFALSQGQTGSSVVDSDGTTLFPERCGSTMSLPRFAFSNGTQLFVADGGNDRVMVYNSIPTQSGQPADEILGEPDEFSDNTGENPDGTDALQTPTSLAYDGLNLYVSDTYNRRVVVFTPGAPNIPLGQALNAASLNIYAIGSIVLGGTIAAKDTVTITVNGTNYTYTVLSTDTLETVTTALAALINKAPDPNVIAEPDDTTDTIVLTARQPGTLGGSVTLAATTSSSASITASASGANLSIYLQNPTSIAPGTLVEVNGQSLCDSTAAADLTQAYLPFTLNGCQIFVDGNLVPLLYVSPTQINMQMPYFFTDRSSVSLYSRVTHADGSITVSSPIPVTIPAQNPGIFAYGGSDPRPGIVYHGSGYATAVVQVNGSVNLGDVGSIIVGPTTYSYTVQATDTLQSITADLINLINGAPDPNVVASEANQSVGYCCFIVLTAQVPGPAGEGIAISQSVLNPLGSDLVLTVVNATTCCDNVQGQLVTNDNPAQPGEVVYLLATGLGVPSPATVDTGAITTAAQTYPPLIPVDSILNGGVSANILNVTLVPGMVGVYQVQFQLATTVTTDLATQTTIAQQTYVSNVVTFPVVVPPTVTVSSARKFQVNKKTGGQTPDHRP